MTVDRRRSVWACLNRCSLAATAVMLAVPNSSAQGQEVDRRWRPMAEIGAAAGGQWLEGAKAPRVSSTNGFFGGVGVQRGVTERISGAAVVRFTSAGIDLSENGATWIGGRTNEVDVLATALLHATSTRAFRVALHASGGVSRVSAPQDLAPFEKASTVMPTGELGVILSFGEATPYSSRRELQLFSTLSARLMSVDDTDLQASGGTFKRIVIGLRAVR